MVTGSSSRQDLQVLAFENLNQYFKDHENETVQIEILPPALEPLGGISLQDGVNLGVPKKTLALAYVEARQQFFASDSLGNDPNSALQATKVMLLFDPEHVTAANYRKRWLRDLEARHGSGVGSAYHKALRQELHFLNSILTSPLHRQSKSPTLWHHRLWLLDPLVLIEMKDGTDDQRMAFWRAELADVCTSGERHPKNYYAWQYARRLVARIADLKAVDIMAFEVKGWCCAHPSDISGWSFLLHLIPKLRQVSREKLITEVLSYAINLRAQQESLWVFIQTVLATGPADSLHLRCLRMIQDYSQIPIHSKQGLETPSRASGALHWIDSHRRTNLQ